MNKIGLIALGVFLFLLVFWLGFMANFPGEAVSNMIETRIKRISGLDVKLSPASLGFFGLSVDSFELGWSEKGKPLKIITLKELYVPLSLQLFSGLPLEASLGNQGRMYGYLAWDGGEARFAGEKIRLEDFTVWESLKPLQVKGALEFSGDLKLPAPGKGRKGNQFPTGTITAKAQKLEITNMEYMGAKLPKAELEIVDVKIKSGQKIELEKFTFRGDFQGSLKGNITPRGNSLKKSTLQLRASTSFRQSWLKKLGAFQPVVESFLDNGRLEGTIQGTFERPRWRKGKVAN